MANETCFLNFPRPFSGVGPATVSSHSLCKNPIRSKYYLNKYFEIIWVFILSLNLFHFFCEENGFIEAMNEQREALNIFSEVNY